MRSPTSSVDGRLLRCCPLQNKVTIIPTIITPKLTYSIRPAQPGDYERVKGLLVDAKITDSEFFTRERFGASIKSWEKYNLVAEKDGTVIGYISGFDDTGIFYGYMGRLVVDPEFRKLGIGESLSSACLAQFKRSGIPVVYVGVHADNEPSKGLLRKIGFSDDGYKLLWKET